MTPCNKIKREILLQTLSELKLDTDEEVEAAFSEWYDDIYDDKNEFRQSGLPTDLPAEYSRHYECERVARQLSDGTWVSWLYWHGGGKHGEPEAIPWMEDAYEVDCVEEEKLVIVRTFSRK